MAIEIRETIVSPGASGDAVQIHISDAARNDESATFVLTIAAKIRPLQTPTLAHLQREAMKIALDSLTPILSRLATELRESGYGLEVPPKRPA